MRYLIILILITVLSVSVCTAGGINHNEVLHHTPKIQKYKLKKEKKERKPLSKWEKIVIFTFVGILIPLFVVYLLYQRGYKVSIIGNEVMAPYLYFLVVSLLVKTLLPDENLANWFLIAAFGYLLYYFIFTLSSSLPFSFILGIAIITALPALLLSITIKRKNKS